MSEHTPTPWLKVEGKPFIYALDENGVNRFQFLVDGAHCSPQELEANARHIVRAVNFHARLVEALREVVEHSQRYVLTKDDLCIDDALELLAELEQQP